MRSFLPAVLVLFFSVTGAYAQQRIKPGFDIQEYLDLLSVTAQHIDSTTEEKPALATHYKRVYRSPVVGLRNRWDLWMRDDQVAVISIRGTTSEAPSWLENFYAAMVPATGSLTLSDSTRFAYQLSADPKAMVHVGWLTGLGYMAPTMLTQIRAQYASGIREFIIIGHSQGGALAFMTRSYLHYLIQKGELPKDLRFKTYCSAAPKPGNLFYAYDFDYITRNGWAFTIVNASDWVPETPFSLQTLNDFNPANPFHDVKAKLRKQPLPVRLYLGIVFSKLDRRTRKTQRTFEKYLGQLMSKQVRKTLPQFQPPAYSSGNNYMRAGVPIVLQPDETYRRTYPDDPNKIFQHHLFLPYYSLAKRIYQPSIP